MSAAWSWKTLRGGVSHLNGHLTLVNSTFTNNEATGTDGNPGNSGCGGAIYMDGTDEPGSLCGVQISNNRAGAIAGGLFRVSNDDTGTLAVDRSTFNANRVTADDGNAGGLYLQGLSLTISNSALTTTAASGSTHARSR